MTGEFCGCLHLGEVRLSSRSDGGYDMFLAKVAPDGRFRWVQSSPHPYSYDSVPMAVDPAGQLYLASQLNQNADVGGTLFLADYASSIVLSKLAADGQSLWHKHIPGYHLSPRALARNASGGVYLAGRFERSIRLGETNIASSAPSSAFLVQITGATPPTITLQPQSSINPINSISRSGSVFRPIFTMWRTGWPTRR